MGYTVIDLFIGRNFTGSINLQLLEEDIAAGMVAIEKDDSHYDPIFQQYGAPPKFYVRRWIECRRHIEW